VAVLVANLWRLVLMVVLLAGSAFCSGSETAFFNLTRRQLHSLAQSTHRVPRLAAWVMRRPERLLTTLLLGNMLVNVSFFSLASVLSVDLGRTVAPALGGAVAVGSFVAVLLFGEMLPKSLAYGQSRAVALAATPIVYVAVRVLGPVLRVFDTWVVAPLLRLMRVGAGPEVTESAVVRQLRTLLQSSRHQGLISSQESRLMTEVLEFGLLKARHVMVPRVDMVLCDVRTTAWQAGERMVRAGVDVLGVWSGDSDNVVGFVRLRDAVLAPDASLESVMRPPIFVPEQKRVESLLELFGHDDVDVVFVVDEYGAVVGAIHEKHVIDTLFGPPTEGMEQPVEQLGPMQYRLAGDLPLHDWAHLFDVDPTRVRVATVGGLVVSHLGRLPRPGDTVRLENLEIRVEDVQRHRIRSVIVTVQPINGQAEGGS